MHSKKVQKGEKEQHIHKKIYISTLGRNITTSQQQKQQSKPETI